MSTETGGVGRLARDIRDVISESGVSVSEPVKVELARGKEKDHQAAALSEGFCPNDSAPLSEGNGSWLVCGSCGSRWCVTGSMILQLERIAEDA